MGEIKPGNRVSIRFYQETMRSENGGEDAKVFASRVFDVLEDGTLELDVPTKEGKLLLLPQNVRYMFEFITDGGIYRCQGAITDRIKRGNFFLMKAKVISKLVKFQRREYYRLNVMMDLMFQRLDDRAGELEKMSDIKGLLQQNTFEDNVIGRGTIVDISGGGVRFISDTRMQDANYLFLIFGIEVNGQKQLVELMAKVIAVNFNPDLGTFTYRMKFIYKDSKMQETIVRFIFEEERRIRKKELG